MPKKSRRKIPWGYEHPTYKRLLRRMEANEAAARAALERAKTRPQRKRAGGKIPWGYGHPKYQALVAGLDRNAAEARTEHDRIAKLPKRIAKRLTWDELEAAARPAPARRRAAAARIAAIPGLAKVPPGYREYLRRFPGAGYWDLVYQKKDWPNQFNLLKPQWMRGDRARLLRSYREEAPALAARWRWLVPFASDASTTYFCWDSSAVDARGEPPVYAADFKQGSDGYEVRRLGKDLLFVLQHYRRPGWAV